jgi:hypothetical protein
LSRFGGEATSLQEVGHLIPLLRYLFSESGVGGCG